MRMRGLLATQNTSPNARRRLRAHWFDKWHDSLDDALKLLPETETCPHDLFRLLVDNPSPARKRVALITEGDAPLAVIGLRRRNFHWDLISEGILPAGMPPCLPGREVDALSALGLFIWVNEWERPVPESRFVRFVQHEQIFRVSTRVDLDSYWDAHGNLKAVRKARKRCERLGEVTLEVDEPGAADWTIGQWESAWADHPWAETVAAPDIRAAANFLAARGKHHSFRLLINGRPVAGLNTIVRGTSLVMGNSGRDAEFDRAGTGVHLDELFYRWSAESPYETVDLGGGFDYKTRWSDPDGLRARFSIAPAHLAAARHGLVVARWVRNRMARAKDVPERALLAAPIGVESFVEGTRWV